MPSTERSFDQLFASLQTLFVTIPELHVYLNRIAWMAANIMDPAASCGVTTHHGGWPITVTASDDLARQEDERQYIADQGPCLDAMQGGAEVRVDDLQADERWEAYRPLAVEDGVRSSLSVPLKGLDDRPIGALNLYSFHHPRAFIGNERQQAQTYASQASRALGRWVQSADQAELTDQLEDALSSRALIDQALGILMAQHRCDANAAFSSLRGQAGNDANRLGRVAAVVITDATRHQPAPETPFTFRRRTV